MEETFKDRLKNEKTELLSKMDKLNSFINSEKFESIDEIQQSLLNIQLKAMETYYECLHHRLAYL